jgi:hypothetical protein
VIENYVYRAPLTNPTYADAEDDVLFHVKSIVDARHGVGCKHGAIAVFVCVCAHVGGDTENACV